MRQDHSDRMNGKRVKSDAAKCFTAACYSHPKRGKIGDSSLLSFFFFFFFHFSLSFLSLSNISISIVVVVVVLVELILKVSHSSVRCIPSASLPPPLLHLFFMPSCFLSLSSFFFLLSSLYFYFLNTFAWYREIKKKSHNHSSNSFADNFSRPRIRRSVSFSLSLPLSLLCSPFSFSSSCFNLFVFAS